MAGLVLSNGLTGCTSSKPGENKQPNSTSGTVTGTSPVYPMKTSTKLRVWASNQASHVCSSYEELPWYKESVKRTGISVEWIHPATGNTLAMMLASGDIPDVILNSWIGFKGGPEKAINDGTILALNEPMDKYMPNLKKFLQTDALMDKAIKTDAGKYYCVPQVRSYLDAKIPGTIYQGPIVRQDWLDELSIKMPATIDDWTVMLKAFKDKKGATAPLTVQKASTGFIGSFGIQYNFYQEDGKVKYGAVQPEYKDYLALMNKWYTEGLLDSEYGKVDGKNETAKITGGQSGASHGLITGQLMGWNTAMKDKNPTFKMVGAPVPAASKNSTKPVLGSYSSRMGGGCAAISATSKNVEVAARWLDWAFTEEGHFTYCFGVPGESYNLVNGSPKVVAEKWEDTDKRYYYSWWNGPYVMGDDSKEEQTRSKDELSYIKQWVTNIEKFVIPEITLSESEGQQREDVMGAIKTYVDSMHLKFIKGEEPLSNFDQYIAQVRKMGIDQGIEITQAALDRYKKR